MLSQQETLPTRFRHAVKGRKYLEESRRMQPGAAALMIQKADFGTSVSTSVSIFKRLILVDKMSIP